MTKICKQCNKSFETNRNKALYCNKSCAISWRNSNNFEIRKKISESLKNSDKAKLAREQNSKDINSNKKRSDKTKLQWLNKKDEMIIGQKNAYINDPSISKKRAEKLKNNEQWRKNVSIAAKKIWKERRDEMLEKCIINPVHNTSNFEILFEQELIKKNYEYKKQYLIDGKIFDFYLPKENILIECDGEYYHPLENKHNGFHYRQIKNLANDVVKNKIAINNNISLYRIRNFDEDFLQSNNYYNHLTKEINFQKYNWKNNETLVNKDYLLRSTDDIRTEIAKEILNFLRNYEISFEDLINQVNIEDLETVYFKLKNKDIINSQSHLGNKILKQYFPNFYDTVNNYSLIQKSSKEIYEDNNLLLNVLLYRCGINNSQLYEYNLNNNKILSHEVFDITAKTILNGINSYYRSNPSVFNVSKALSIYKNNCQENDTVYDPSFGFGGRMFAASICNLNYIGTDPNTKTYHNALKFKNDILKLNTKNKIELYNECSENLVLKNDSIDFIFTSIPYFDTEVYCKEETQSYIKYPLIDSWIKNYLEKTLINCRNAIKNNKFIAINVNENILQNLLKCAQNINLKFVKQESLISSTIHFNKSNNIKNEFLVYFQK